MVFTCAITSEINLTRLPTALADAARVEVRPVRDAPDPTLISHEQSLTNWGETWRSAMATAESQYPGARWHLVMSAPVSVAIEAGRAVMRNAHPAMSVYELVDDLYESVLVINE